MIAETRTLACKGKIALGGKSATRATTAFAHLASAELLTCLPCSPLASRERGKMEGAREEVEGRRERITEVRGLMTYH